MVGDEIMLSASGEGIYSYSTEVISLKASVLVADRRIIDRKFPKDLRDYLRRLSFVKEKGRKVLLENKVNEIVKEAQGKHQAERHGGGAASAAGSSSNVLSMLRSSGGSGSSAAVMSHRKHHDSTVISGR